MSDRDAPPFGLIRTPGPDHDRDLARRRLGLCRLPPSLGDHAKSARYYRPSADLVTAINMAIHVGAPLLLTGEPGTGKTQVADFVGDFFGIPVFKFQVRSTSTADDIKYDFDAVAYLHWAQSARGEPGGDPGANRTRRDFLRKRALWNAYEHPTESVLLIDEIDKAPRDFPNDLLHELDQHRFVHPFADDELIAPHCGRPPIVVVTSNDERRLPDAFLRRAIFHRIELTETLIESAVAAHAGDFPRLDAATRAAAQARFWELRASPLDKKPSTAELLVWLCILSARGESAQTIGSRPLAELPGIGALVKDAQDLAVLR
jgi:MoxR-like ATPase